MRLLHQTEIGLVDQGCGLQRVGGHLTPEVTLRDLVQFMVDEGNQSVQDATVALPQLLQQYGHGLRHRAIIALSALRGEDGGEGAASTFGPALERRADLPIPRPRRIVIHRQQAIFLADLPSVPGIVDLGRGISRLHAGAREAAHGGDQPIGGEVSFDSHRFEAQTAKGLGYVFGVVERGRDAGDMPVAAVHSTNGHRYANHLAAGPPLEERLQRGGLRLAIVTAR